jgi:hypothetical protein
MSTGVNGVRFLAFLNIDHRADVPEKFAALGKARRRGIERPAINTVVAPEAVVQAHGFVLLIRNPERLLGRGAIILMDRLHPAKIKRGLSGLSGELEPAIVEMRASASGIRDPKHHG